MEGKDSDDAHDQDLMDMLMPSLAQPSHCHRPQDQGCDNEEHGRDIIDPPSKSHRLLGRVANWIGSGEWRGLVTAKALPTDTMRSSYPRTD
jgi:hypothetical protein